MCYAQSHSTQTLTKMPKRCRWSAQDDRTLDETLLTQKAAGNQAQSGWKPVVWNAVAAELKKIVLDNQAEKTATKCNDHYSNVRVGYNLNRFFITSD